jgi:hypothetical protein
VSKGSQDRKGLKENRVFQVKKVRRVTKATKVLLGLSALKVLKDRPELLDPQDLLAHKGCKA